MSPSCFDLLDAQIVAGGADDVALAAGSQRWTYARLLEEVAAFGGVLRHCGVRPGDPVGISLSESVELVVAVLACGRIGAAHSFEPRGTVVVTDASVRETEATVVIVRRRPGVEVELREGRDHDWEVVMRAGRTDPAACEEGATFTPYDARTAGLLGPLLDGGTVELDQG